MPNPFDISPIAIVQITPLQSGIRFLNFALHRPNIQVITTQALSPNELLIGLRGSEPVLKEAITTFSTSEEINDRSINYHIISDPHPDLLTFLEKITQPENITPIDRDLPDNRQEKPIKPIQQELVAINHELYQAGFITAVGGNISARDPDQPDQLWITPGSIFKGNIQADQLVRINLDGEEIFPGSYHASSEKYMHSQILKEHPEFNAVIHSHGKFTTILILAGLPFLQLSAESCFVGDMKRIPFIKSGTPELGKAVAEAIRGTNAVLLQNHGIVVAGKSLRSAADLTMIIEENAEKIIMCYLLGTPPPALPPDVVEYYRKLSVIRG